MSAKDFRGIGFGTGKRELAVPHVKGDSCKEFPGEESRYMIGPSCFKLLAPRIR